MSSKIPLVVFAEDDDEDWILVEEVLTDSCKGKVEYERVKDGAALLQRLRDESKPPVHLVMLDLKMPRMDGIEALKEIRAENRGLPVVVMTTSKLDADISGAYKNGANSYVCKPVSFPAMQGVLSSLYHYWTQVVELPGVTVSPAIAKTSHR